MNMLVISILVLHIAVGTIALLVGLVPMFVQKGSRLHKRAGLVFVYCMITVAITALLLCALQPFKMMRLFLTGIAVLSFYLTMTGWRATKQKTTGPTLADRGLTYVTLLVSLAMVGFGIYLLALNGASFLPTVFTFFGVLTFVFARRDIQLMNRPTQKMHWFFQHFTRMGGAYIATFTAAIVTNIDRIAPAGSPEWIGTLLWIAPSLVGGILISRTVRHYMAKFSAKANAGLTQSKL